MDQAAARYRAARSRLAADVGRAVGGLPPDVAGSALGRAMAAELLVAEAVALLGGDADLPAARTIAAELAAAAVPGNAAGLVLAAPSREGRDLCPR